MAAPSQFLQLRVDELSSRVQDNINATLRPLAEAIGATPIMGAPPPAWIAPSLVNGFANQGLGFAVAGYHKDALGYVHAKGVILDSTAAGIAANTAAFTFGKGYRPAETLLIPAYGAAATVQFLSVSPAGVVTVLVALAASARLGFYFSFLAEG